MTTTWLKAAYTRQDRDSETGELLPGAVAPGIYCADAESFAAFKAAVIDKGRVLTFGPDGPGYEGLTIRIATPEQVAMFEAGGAYTVDPRPASKPAPVGNRVQRRAAEARARRRA